MGDPIERLSAHLIADGVLTREDIATTSDEVVATLEATVAEAEKLGTMNSGPKLSASHMFEHVYAETPRHLLEQRQELGI